MREPGRWCGIWRPGRVPRDLCWPSGRSAVAQGPSSWRAVLSTSTPLPEGAQRWSCHDCSGLGATLPWRDRAPRESTQSPGPVRGRTWCQEPSHAATGVPPGQRDERSGIWWLCSRDLADGGIGDADQEGTRSPLLDSIGESLQREDSAAWLSGETGPIHDHPQLHRSLVWRGVSARVRRSAFLVFSPFPGAAPSSLSCSTAAIVLGGGPRCHSEPHRGGGAATDRGQRATRAPRLWRPRRLERGDRLERDGDGLADEGAGPEAAVRTG